MGAATTGSDSDAGWGVGVELGAVGVRDGAMGVLVGMVGVRVGWVGVGLLISCAGLLGRLQPMSNKATRDTNRFIYLPDFDGQQLKIEN
jgi:hypothetical protein